MLEGLRLWWHGLQTRRKMNRVFGRGSDPFKYSKEGYEHRRLEAMTKLVGKPQRVLELGCAEGHFTERLAVACPDVTAVDISAVALSRVKARAKLVEADAREFIPEGRFDLIVVGDVLYYLDKPLVRDAFEAVFPRISSWLEPGGRVLLAHGFAGPQEERHRRSFTERFQKAGLTLVCESVVPGEGPVSCLIALLRK